LDIFSWRHIQIDLKAHPASSTVSLLLWIIVAELSSSYYYKCIEFFPHIHILIYIVMCRSCAWLTDLFLIGLLESESYITTDGQSASLSWNKAPIWGLRPDFYYCQTVAGFLIWGTVSDERTNLSFTIAAGPRQRSHSQVRVLWDSTTIFYCLRFKTSLFVPSYDSADDWIYWLSQYNHLPNKTTVSNNTLILCLPIRCLEMGSSIVACRFISVGTCLPSHSLVMNYSDFQSSCHNIFLDWRIMLTKILT
jgi:hypothetical protein